MIVHPSLRIAEEWTTMAKLSLIVISEDVHVELLELLELYCELLIARIGLLEQK